MQIRDLKGRIEDIIKYKDLNISTLELELGVPNAFIGKFLRGDKKDINLNTIERISNKYPDINPAWLLTGEGEMILKKGRLVTDKPLIPIHVGNISTEILPMRAMAGPLMEQYIGDFERQLVLMPQYTYRMQLLIEVDGDSMEPTYVKGDKVVLCHILPNEVKDKEVHVIQTRAGEVMIKRVIVDHKKKIFMLISDNTYYNARSLEEHEVFMVFKVLGKFTPKEDYDPLI